VRVQTLCDARLVEVDLVEELLHRIGPLQLPARPTLHDRVQLLVEARQLLEVKHQLTGPRIDRRLEVRQGVEDVELLAQRP
jgi:hypothetical protein